MEISVNAAVPSNTALARKFTFRAPPFFSCKGKEQKGESNPAVIGQSNNEKDKRSNEEYNKVCSK